MLSGPLLPAVPAVRGEHRDIGGDDLPQHIAGGQSHSRHHARYLQVTPFLPSEQGVAGGILLNHV